MSVNVKFKVGIKKNINTSFNVENKEPIRTIFRINAGTAAFSSILGSPYDNTALAAALNLKADKTAVAEQIETVTDLINLTSETLDNKIDSVQSSLAGDISTLAQTVESYNAATNLRIDETNTTVADNFTTLNGKIEINTQAISDLTQTVADNYKAVNNRIDGVVTSFDGDISNLESAIQNEAEARANADTTLQGNINTLSNTVTSNYNTLDAKIDNTKTAIDGDISDLSDTVSANYTDLSGQISDLSGTVESYNTATNGRIDTLSQTVSANDTAINNKVDGINTTLTNSINSLSNTVTDNYNALDARITANTGNIATNAGNITTINSKIPNQASSSNQLADKDFVNSSIATNTANFIGTFNSVAELEAYSGTLTNNDYAFVATTDAVGNTLYDRYKWNGSEWLFEYELNNSSFTAAQWAAINSGATSANVGQITTNANNIADLQTNKQDVLTAGDNIQIVNNVISATDTTYTAGTGISIVDGVISNTQTSAIWGNITGTLSNQTDLQDALNSKYDASNPNNYTSNTGTVTSVNGTQPDSNGNVTITIPSITVDQIFDPTSENAQSGVAISGAGFLRNTGTGLDSIDILGNAGTGTHDVFVGYESGRWQSATELSIESTCFGYQAQTGGAGSCSYGALTLALPFATALGYGARALANSSIQLGYGSNNTPNWLYVGFYNTSSGHYNYPLLNGTTGLIPDERLSSNIARTSQIPSVELSYYGTCATSASTQAKVVVCTGFTLKTGVSIRVKFTNAQSYNGQPTLNVNSTGAKNITLRGTTASMRYIWQAGEVVDFTYDGTNWIWERGGVATTSYYGVTKLSSSLTSTSTALAATPSTINGAMQNIVTGYPVYSASATYEVGDRVRYSSYVWECATAITEAEAWNAEHWTTVDPIQTQVDGKVDKITGTYKIYGTDGNGGQTSYTLSSGVTSSSSIPLRNANGQISVAEIPTADGHATSKKYVDTGLSGKQATLVSGTSIKTINNTNILGSGNIDTKPTYNSTNERLVF